MSNDWKKKIDDWEEREFRQKQHEREVAEKKRIREESAKEAEHIYKDVCMKDAEKL